MAHCARTKGLHVYHLSLHGGEDLDNAIVLCEQCFAETPPHWRRFINDPPDFSAEVHAEALSKAGGICQCTGCAACLEAHPAG